MKSYVNIQLGIAFEYPAEWILIKDCKTRFGVDVLLTYRSSNFGIVKVSEQLRENYSLLNYNNLDKYTQMTLMLKSSVQKNEMIIEDIKLNKYKISSSDSATITLSRWDKRIGANMINERTLLIYGNHRTEFFTIVFETPAEEYGSIECKNHLRNAIESFRII